MSKAAHSGEIAAAAGAGLSFQVYSLVRAVISDRSIDPGSVLLEAVLADALVTSRTPVRVALKRLREEGLLHKLAGRGYLVADRDGGRSAVRQRRPVTREAFAALAGSQLEGRARTASTRVHEDIEVELATAIIFGPLRIVERELGKRYGVSRTVVREALSRLETSGLIAKDERLHWRVPPLTVARAEEFYELRRALEPAALRAAAARGQLTEVAKGMRDRLAALLGRLDELRPPDLQAVERELHVDVLGRCGNREIMKALWSAQVQIVTNERLFQRFDKWFPAIIGEHLIVAARLAKGDVEGAVEALVAHLDSAKVRIVDDVIGSGSEWGAEELPPYLQPA
ncbi:MAG: GntR family transcriptional regulator [Hansschlegelia sp.]